MCLLVNKMLETTCEVDTINTKYLIIACEDEIDYENVATELYLLSLENNSHKLSYIIPKLNVEYQENIMWIPIKYLGRSIKLMEGAKVHIKNPRINLFAYGTFMSRYYDMSDPNNPELRIPGERNHILKTHLFVRSQLDDFARIWPPNAKYPFAIKREGHYIVGETYLDFSEKELKEIDLIEGEGYLYQRIKVTVQSLDDRYPGKIEAFTYIATDELKTRYNSDEMLEYPDIQKK